MSIWWSRLPISSLEFDRGAKLELYARGGIREFWIVDLTTNRVLVHRDPTDGAYTSVTIVDMSGTLQVEALPEVMIQHLEFFGSRLPAGWQTR